jgi:hypothetical protein
VTLPRTACTAPNADFYSSFNGITIGVAGFLLWIGLLWGLGRAILRWRGKPLHSVTAFDRSTLSRVILFLTLTYAPVTEKVLSVFSCRRISDSHYLREEPSKVCFDATNRRYRGVGAFWIVFYVVGGALAFQSSAAVSLLSQSLRSIFI